MNSDPSLRAWRIFVGRTLAVVVAAGLSLAIARPAAADKPAPGKDSLARFRQAQLMLHFQGKGSILPYDAGVITAAYRYLPALRDNRVVIGGNSSGAILAVYFSCFGFSEASVKYAAYRTIHGDVSAIHGVEDIIVLTHKLMHHEKTEIDHIVLKEYVAFALGVQDWQGARTFDDITRRSTARPRLPVIIIAANKEVLDNLVPGQTLEGQDYKIFDPRNFSVSWKPEVFEFYRRHPDRFQREHPNLKLGPTPYIGKAVTYFVDPQMYALLSRIPAEERQGDLRLMETPADLATAILASGAEPTYFPPLVESKPNKLTIGDRWGDLGNSRQRLYCGGYIMPLAAQDVRRMVPSIRVMGTGSIHLPKLARHLLSAWYLADMEPLAELSSWWADMECSPDSETQNRLASRKVPPAEEFRLGLVNAERCLSQDEDQSIYIARPAHDQAGADAIYADDVPANAANAPDGSLAVQRGLGKLIARPTTPAP